jgi:hypothetical protein
MASMKSINIRSGSNSEIINHEKKISIMKNGNGNNNINKIEQRNRMA